MAPSKKGKRVLTEERLIAGYFRDALLNKAAVTSLNTDIPMFATIDGIDESISRGKEGRKFIDLRLIDQNFSTANFWTELKKNSSLTLRLSLERMTIEFDTEFVHFSDGLKIRINFPETATLSILRNHHRFNSKHISPSVTLVQLFNEGSKDILVGLFRLTDVGRGGIGGTLFVNSDFDQTKEYSIKGKLTQTSGSINLSGKVVRIEKTSDRNSYNIGIWSEEDRPSLVVDESEKNKRSASRVPATFPIELISPVNPNIPVQFHVEDISMRGMKLRVINFSNSALFKLGLEVFVTNPKIRAKIVNLDPNYVFVEFLKSSIEEHIKLFNLICTYSEKDVVVSTAVAEDILQLFAVSGSLSTSLARNQSFFQEDLVNKIGLPPHESPWFLRWNQQSQDGQIRGSIITALYGNNLWYNGGLAGHLDEELKMSKDFVPRYYKRLSEFFDGIGDHEYVFFNWMTNLTWWKDWEDKLANTPHDDTFYRFKGNIMYFKSIPAEFTADISSFKVKNLSQVTPSVIEKELSDLPKREFANLFRALGLSQFSFGPRLLSELLHKNKHQFTREFYSVELDDLKLLIAVHNFPIETTPNGIMNYPFVYGNKIPNDEQLKKISMLVLNLASELGVYTPAFFFTENGNSISVDGDKQLVNREIIWTFARADVLRYWKEK